MDEDASSPGWTGRAACRWVTYSLLWSIAVGAALCSAYHPVLRIIAGLFGCILAISLPVLFATLFEMVHIRQSRYDIPIICLPPCVTNHCWIIRLHIGYLLARPLCHALRDGPHT